MTTFIGGVKRVELTGGLLSLISMMQDYQDFLISQNMFSNEYGLVRVDVCRKLEERFAAIDDSILREHGLSKNKFSFEKVMGFKITDEMKYTEYHLLPQRFTF